MKKMLTVWHVGGEDVRMRIPLLKALQKRGFSVGAIGTEDSKIFEDNNIPYKQYSLHRWVGPLSDYQSFKQLRRIFSEIDADLVHGFDTKPAILTPLAASQVSGLKALRTVTGMGYVFSSQSLIAYIIKPIYRLCQKVASDKAAKTIFQNPDDKNYFEDTGLIANDKSLLVRGSGIDISEFLERQVSPDRINELKNDLNIQGKRVVTMVARLVRDKGVTEFMEAARNINKKHNDVAFLLIGPTAGEGREAIGQDEIEQFSDVVTYLGRRADIPDLLGLSDIFVLPSYYREGLPRVLLEAGVASLPLITTDMPGCKEVVIEGFNGWLVKPRCTLDLTSKLEEALLLSECELKSMGEKSKRLVCNEFSLDKVADAYAETYKNIVGNNL